MYAELKKSYSDKHLSSSVIISPVSVRDGFVFLEVARFGMSASVAQNAHSFMGREDTSQCRANL